jgi:hypothetical protein
LIQVFLGNRVAETQALNHNDVSGIEMSWGIFGQNCRCRVVMTASQGGGW